MKAYKVFNSDWTCRGFQYEVGKTYTHEGKVELCSAGFQACKKVSDCFSDYSFNPANKVAEVELSGVVLGEDQAKQCSSVITIMREVSWEEMLTLANTEVGNSGTRNSGSGNSGTRNSGSGNSGSRNSGSGNSGSWNSGDGNSGDGNSGDWNSGTRNSGDWNSGSGNSGSRNSGSCNSGDGNSGTRNSGDRNSGSGNSGSRNSGSWNSGDGNSGMFNTTDPFVRLFNKDTNLTRGSLNIPSFLYFKLTQWVSHDTATEEEKAEHKQDIETCGGFLKTLAYKDAFKRAWVNAGNEERQQVQNLPNFDADIFFEISGIRV